jgi:hypothetical protein
MKTKAILFLSIAAVLTLSFTFVSVNRFSAKGPENVRHEVSSTSNEQLGGFAMEDKL